MIDALSLPKIGELALGIADKIVGSANVDVEPEIEPGSNRT
jgi:hypothetical protein